MTEIDENSKFEHSNKTIGKYPNDWKFELFALFGFCVSGIVFILSGIQSGDIFTILGSSVWIFSCVIWMIPYRKYFDTSNDKSDCKYHNPITNRINSDK